MKKLLLVLALTQLVSFVPTYTKKSPKRKHTSTCCSGSSCCGSPQKPKKNNEPGNELSERKKREVISKAYDAVAQSGDGCSVVGGCCGGGADLSKYIGYSDQEIEELADANLGLGCGNPIKLGDIPRGATVVDLGSGAGFDCFLAAKRVGAQGRVIGIDMTQSMLEKARKNAEKYGFTNVQFLHGDIEQLPLEDNSVDIIMSNCVINLAPNKANVFKEANRVLKPGGKMYVSDVVLCTQLSDEQRNDTRLLSACVAGAILEDEYLDLLSNNGFSVTVIERDKQINRKWFDSDELPIASIKYVAVKK